MKAKIFTLVLVLLLAAGLDFAVCQNNNSFIGTWTGTNFLIGETSFTFASDNTFTMSTMGITSGGVYTVLGDRITLTPTLLGVPQERIIGIRNGNNLVIDGTVYTKGQAQGGPQTAVEYNRRGLEYYNKGDWDNAIADFTQVIRLAPNEAASYSNRAAAYYSKGDWDNAIADLNQAIRLNANNALYYNNRGMAYINKGDWDNAIADYTQAIRLDANNALYYSNRAFAYGEKGDYNRAIADATNAIRLDANLANAYRHRGFAYMKQRKWRQARADVNRCLQLNPDYQRGKDLDAELKSLGH